MYYVSEAKLKNSKADTFKDCDRKIQPGKYMTPLLVIDQKGDQATFQEAMKLIIIIGQFFGLNPVIGVTESDTTKLRFQIRSWRVVYSILSIIGQSTLVCFCFLKLFTDSNPNLSANASLVFYTTNCITTILFLRVAMRWSKICQHISRTEASDPSVDGTLVKKCKVSCVLILSLAILEHVLSDLSGIAGAIDCQEGRNVFEAFAVGSFPWIFNYTGYTPYLAILAQFINLQFTFNWNFSDVFVICISFYLTSRLEHINRRIEAIYGKHVPTSLWRTLREDYNRVTGLVRRVDDVIGGIIFISFANNLFFICLQLLHTLAFYIYSVSNMDFHPPWWFRYDGIYFPLLTYLFFPQQNTISCSSCMPGTTLNALLALKMGFTSVLDILAVASAHCVATIALEGLRRTPSCRIGEADERPLQGYEQTVYFVYSFGFLITRSLAVSLIASRVHTASREPAHMLYCVPSTSYSVEVQRFLDQVHCDTVALSGLKFFNVKRGLVLTIAGTIVTYELVLMQFTGVTTSPPPPTITMPTFINTSKV